MVDDLAWITASDTDFGDDDTFIYDIVGLGEGDSYFLMTDTGRLRIRSPIQLDYDRIFKFTISGTVSYIWLGHDMSTTFPWAEVMKLFSCSPKLSMKFIMLINV